MSDSGSATSLHHNADRSSIEKVPIKEGEVYESPAGHLLRLQINSAPADDEIILVDETKKDPDTESAITSTASTSSSLIEKDPTDWRAVFTATVVTLVCNIEINILGLSEWPYMTTIDHEATSQFFGVCTSMSKLFHAFSVFGFSIWSYKCKVVKWPLIVCRIIAVFGCILYLIVENRRYVMLACYIIFSISAGPIPLLKSYVAMVSSAENRTRAMAMTNAALLISVILAPITQLCFSSIPYPGKQMGAIHFNMFSAPIWVALCTNMICFVVIIFFFKDVQVKREPRPESTGETRKCCRCPSWWQIKAAILRGIHFIRTVPFSWPLIIFVMAEKCLSQVNLSTLSAIGAVAMLAVFDLNTTQTVQVTAIGMICVGILAVIIALLMIFTPVKRISAHTLFIVACIIFVFMYILSFPYPAPLGQHLKPFNVSTRSGCNAEQYKWCDTATHTTIVLFVIVMILVMGFAIPLAITSTDGIFSRMLGDIDQGPMQGVLNVAEDIVNVLTPLYSSWLFAAYGLGTVWITNAVIAAIILIVWVVMRRWIMPFAYGDKKPE